jgi:hypothetical protein
MKITKEEASRKIVEYFNQHQMVGGKWDSIMYTQKKFVMELLNQQLEVDHECKYCGAMTTEPDEYCYRNPNSKEKQPEQEEIDAMTFIQEECRKEYGRGFITVDTISTYFAAQILERWSTLTQDKVREAAEKVVEVYRNAIQEEPINKTIEELEKALNKNK